MNQYILFGRNNKGMQLIATYGGNLTDLADAAAAWYKEQRGKMWVISIPAGNLLGATISPVIVRLSVEVVRFGSIGTIEIDSSQ